MDINKLFTPLPHGEFLRDKSVFVAGCGGLGGYLAVCAAKCGFGKIILCDFDKFNNTNLNRQFGCTEKTVGLPKAQVMAGIVKNIDSQIQVISLKHRITRRNCRELISGCDIILDGLDSIKTRLILENAAERARLHIVHGGIEGEMCQAAVVPPGSKMLRRIYAGHHTKRGVPVLSFTPAFCAALQVNMAAAFLLGKAHPGYGRFIIVNLHSFSSQICDI